MDIYPYNFVEVDIFGAEILQKWINAEPINAVELKKTIHRWSYPRQVDTYKKLSSQRVPILNRCALFKFGLESLIVIEVNVFFNSLMNFIA